MVHEAFKIVRQARGEGGGGMMAVYEDDDTEGRVLEGAEEVREEVARMANNINMEGVAYMDAVRWWAERVWGPAKAERDGDRWEEAWQACSFSRFREQLMKRGKNKGVGVDGWSVRLAQEQSELCMWWHYQWVREAMERVEIPQSYSEWVAILLNKPGEDPRKLGRKRDIWLMCHGLKVMTMLMQGEYERLAGVEGSGSQGGWEVGRGAPEMTLTLKLQEEQCRQLGTTAFRGYIDLGTFFMSVVREVAEEVERHLGVSPSVARVIKAI